jgi:hypothetical protein
MLRAFAFLAGLLATTLFADPPSNRPAREALQPLSDLIGSWKGTGTPGGGRADPNAFWTETIAWEWQFRGRDAWLKVTFDKGKHFTAGELRPLAEKDAFALTLHTPENQKRTFTGALKDRVLTVEREEKGERHRLVVTLLHANRFLYRHEVRPEGKGLYRRLYQVGATKEGVPFAGGDGRPECVVSGGVGTMPVTFQGKTYHVCCGGCRAEFQEDPAKYVKEYEARRVKQK